MVDDSLEEPADQTPEPPALNFPVPFTGRVGKYQSRPPQQFGAPRRFGIGSILVVMAAASMLLAYLISWGVPGGVVLHIIGFTTLIGFAQSILYKGSNPRLASIVGGLVLCPVYLAGVFIFIVITQPAGRLSGLDGGAGLLCTWMASFLFGPLFGYLSGGIVGGIFLVMDRWEKNFGRQEESTKSFDPFAPDPIDGEVLSEDEGSRMREAEET